MKGNEKGYELKKQLSGHKCKLTMNVVMHIPHQVMITKPIPSPFGIVSSTMVGHEMTS
jgi:hypothetical protein